jgi:hypothetical protein
LLPPVPSSVPSSPTGGSVYFSVSRDVLACNGCEVQKVSFIKQMAEALDTSQMTAAELKEQV